MTGSSGAWRIPCVLLPEQQWESKCAKLQPCKHYITRAQDSWGKNNEAGGQRAFLTLAVRTIRSGGTNSSAP